MSNKITEIAKLAKNLLKDFKDAGGLDMARQNPERLAEWLDRVCEFMNITKETYSNLIWTFRKHVKENNSSKLSDSCELQTFTEYATNWIDRIGMILDVQDIFDDFRIDLCRLCGITPKSSGKCKLDIESIFRRTDFALPVCRDISVGGNLALKWSSFFEYTQATFNIKSEAYRFDLDDYVGEERAEWLEEGEAWLRGAVRDTFGDIGVVGPLRGFDFRRRCRKLVASISRGTYTNITRWGIDGSHVFRFTTNDGKFFYSLG